MTNLSSILRRTWWRCVTRKKFSSQSKTTITLSLWGWKISNSRCMRLTWTTRGNNNTCYGSLRHSRLGRTTSYSLYSRGLKGTVRSRLSIDRLTANGWYNATGIYWKIFSRSKPLSSGALVSSSNLPWAGEKKRQTKRSKETWAWSLMIQDLTHWCHAFSEKWTTRWAPSSHLFTTSTVLENTLKNWAKCPCTTTTIALLEKVSTRWLHTLCAPKSPQEDRCILANRLQFRWPSWRSRVSIRSPRKLWLKWNNCSKPKNTPSRNKKGPCNYLRSENWHQKEEDRRFNLCFA